MIINTILYNFTCFGPTEFHKRNCNYNSLLIMYSCTFDNDDGNLMYFENTLPRTNLIMYFWFYTFDNVLLITYSCTFDNDNGNLMYFENTLPRTQKKLKKYILFTMINFVLVGWKYHQFRYAACKFLNQV